MPYVRSQGFGQNSRYLLGFVAARLCELGRVGLFPRLGLFADRLAFRVEFLVSRCRWQGWLPACLDFYVRSHFLVLSRVDPADEGCAHLHILCRSMKSHSYFHDRTKTVWLPSRLTGLHPHHLILGRVSHKSRKIVGGTCAATHFDL